MHKPSILRKIEEYDICELVFTPKKDGDPSGAEACHADATANAKDGEGCELALRQAFLECESRGMRTSRLGQKVGIAEVGEDGPLVAFGPKLPGTHTGAHGVDEHVMLENISKATDIYEAALEALVELSA